MSTSPSAALGAQGTAPAAPSFASLLAAGRSDAIDRGVLKRLLRQGLLPLAVIGAALGAWAASAPLAGAVVAAAHVKVELNRKTVQHQEGGIVHEILVREGQNVRAGEPLVVIGDVRSHAELDLLRDMARAALARKARAAAEAALAPHMALPAELESDAAAAEHVMRERALFTARRRTLDEQVLALQAQIQQSQAQASALDARIEATAAAQRMSAEELELNERLVQQGFVNRTRLLSLQRAEADYRARVAEYRGELAASRQRGAELQARIAQLRNQYQSEGANELKDAAVRVRELEQKLRPSHDQVERQLVRAPVDGQVMGVRVAAVGSVVGPREAILDIVPANEKLVFEARIRPEDIEHVNASAKAEVRLVGVDAATIRPLDGAVVFVSPDRVSKPETGETFFVATVEVSAATLQNRRDVRLLPGMPAEVYIATTERTLLEYLTKPLMLFSNRALREP